MTRRRRRKRRRTVRTTVWFSIKQSSTTKHNAKKYISVTESTALQSVLSDSTATHRYMHGEDEEVKVTATIMVDVDACVWIEMQPYRARLPAMQYPLMCRSCSEKERRAIVAVRRGMTMKTQWIWSRRKCERRKQKKNSTPFDQTCWTPKCAHFTNIYVLYLQLQKFGRCSIAGGTYLPCALTSLIVIVADVRM